MSERKEEAGKKAGVITMPTGSGRKEMLLRRLERGNKIVSLFCDFIAHLDCHAMMHKSFEETDWEALGKTAKSGVAYRTYGAVQQGQYSNM